MSIQMEIAMENFFQFWFSPLTGPHSAVASNLGFSCLSLHMSPYPANIFLLPCTHLRKHIPVLKMMFKKYYHLEPFLKIFVAVWVGCLPQSQAFE